MSFILADEFVLTHRTVFPTVRSVSSSPVSERTIREVQRVNVLKLGSDDKTVSKSSASKRVCFYCLNPGHLISDCRAWKQKQSGTKPKGVAFVQSLSVPDRLHSSQTSFDPFIMESAVALSNDSKFKSIVMLRDTGSAQSLILESVLPFSSQSYTGTEVLIRGVELGCVPVPLHTMYIKSNLISGPVKIGVRSHLPVEGVSMILGNDLVGGKVFPCPIVSAEPDVGAQTDVSKMFPSVFPACAVTRAHAQRFGDVVDISESFLPSSADVVESKLSVMPRQTAETATEDQQPPLKVGREQLAAAQRADPNLIKCIDAAVDRSQVSKCRVGYFWEGDILMRWWNPQIADDDSHMVYQIVLPSGYHAQVLHLAHEHVCSGHLGVTKTYQRLIKHFFWPGVKSAVSKLVKSCHACQLAGKPNQIIPQAPLQPIPVMGEPFERLLIDCVGPLPKSKSGYQYILTMMCTATRYPEAIPLRSIKTKAVVKELIKFCSIFGLPKVIQTDQGSNFTSHIFEQTVQELGVEHRLSSAYHPESQGALERFHQTLKSMMRAYCIESGKDWAEGLPLLLFAVRGTKQESLGFSPAELVFGHTVRGPLKLLSEQFLTKNSALVSTFKYVSYFREKLHKAWDVAKAHLAGVQAKMKIRYNQKSVVRSFQPGDSVLVLLPVPGSVMQAKFSGPYVIDKRLSDTNYVIRTPDRRRKSRMCHINMLKAYVSRDEAKPVVPVNPISVDAVLNCPYSPEADGLVDRNAQVSCGRLPNSACLSIWSCTSPICMMISVVVLLNWSRNTRHCSMMFLLKPRS